MEGSGQGHSFLKLILLFYLSGFHMEAGVYPRGLKGVTQSQGANLLDACTMHVFYWTGNQSTWRNHQYLHQIHGKETGIKPPVPGGASKMC